MAGQDFTSSFFAEGKLKLFRTGLRRIGFRENAHGADLPLTAMAHDVNPREVPAPMRERTGRRASQGPEGEAA